MAYSTTSDTRATAFWTGSAFASGFWLLDTGSVLWSSNAGLLHALMPDGSHFSSRLLVAVGLAAAGALLGGALAHRRRRAVRTSDRLQHCEEKYQALLASSFATVLTLDSEGRIVEAGPSAAALLDTSAGQLIGQPVDRFVAVGPGPLAVAGRSFTTMLNEGAFVEGDSVAIRLRTYGNREFPAQVRVTALSGGDDVCHVISMEETTDRVVAEKALRRSEMQYRALFDNILDGVCRSRPDGVLLAANAALVKMLGYESREELLELANTHRFYQNAEQRTQIQALLEQYGEARNVELDLRRRDGNVITVLANIRSITDNSGAEVVYESSMSDISDLLKARAALLESEQHFRALAENSRDIISVIDAAGTIIYNSPSSSQVTGVPPHKQLGGDFFHHMHEDDVSEVRSLVRQGFARPGTPKRFVCRVHAEDGSLRHLEAVGTAYLTAQKELRAVINSRDVTERLETEAELRRMHRLQTVVQLTDGIAHDFNNLLTVMGGNLDMVDDLLTDDSARNYLNSARDACRRGSDLVRRLVTFSGEQGSQVESVNVNGLLLDIEPVVRSAVSEAVDYQCDLEQDLWLVQSSPDQLEEALLQLIMHVHEARGAWKPCGRISVITSNCPAGDDARCPAAVKPDIDTVRIRITCTDPRAASVGRSDSGHMSRQEIGAVPGNSFGLSAVQAFIESVGGGLHLSAGATEIRIYLPRHTNGSNAVATEAKPAARGAERILVVDDDAAVRRATSGLLRSLGYTVSVAPNGQAALHLMQTESVELLLSDLNMPRVSGIELAAMAHARWPHLKVLLTSGSDMSAAELDRGDGISFIPKPFRKEELAQRVRAILDRQPINNQRVD